MLRSSLPIHRQQRRGEIFSAKLHAVSSSQHHKEILHASGYGWKCVYFYILLPKNLIFRGEWKVRASTTRQDWVHIDNWAFLHTFIVCSAWRCFGKIITNSFVGGFVRKRDWVSREDDCAATIWLVVSDYCQACDWWKIRVIYMKLMKYSA